MKRTSVWSSSELEMAASDYISHFREYKDRENRGQLYEMLRPYTFFLIMVVTPRILTEEESVPPRNSVFTRPTPNFRSRGTRWASL